MNLCIPGKERIDSQGSGRKSGARLPNMLEIEVVLKTFQRPHENKAGCTQIDSFDYLRQSTPHSLICHHGVHFCGNRKKCAKAFLIRNHEKPPLSEL